VHTLDSVPEELKTAVSDNVSCVRAFCLVILSFLQSAVGGGNNQQAPMESDNRSIHIEHTSIERFVDDMVSDVLILAINAVQVQDAITLQPPPSNVEQQLTSSMVSASSVGEHFKPTSLDIVYNARNTSISRLGVPQACSIVAGRGAAGAKSEPASGGRSQVVVLSTSRPSADAAGSMPVAAIRVRSTGKHCASIVLFTRIFIADAAGSDPIYVTGDTASALMELYADLVRTRDTSNATADHKLNSDERQRVLQAKFGKLLQAARGTRKLHCEHQFCIHALTCMQRCPTCFSIHSVRAGVRWQHHNYQTPPMKMMMSISGNANQSISTLRSVNMR
jgi:hypothetical protein